MKKTFRKKQFGKESGSLKEMSVQKEVISMQTEVYELRNVSNDSGHNNAEHDKSCEMLIYEDDDCPKPLKETFVCIRTVCKYHVTY